MSTDQQQTRPVTITEPTDLEIHVERVFDAPRELVFSVFHDPELIPEWWGDTTVVDEMDVRPGGSWRFVARYANGYEMAFHGTYREVAPPERSVRTFEAEGQPGVIVETVVFEDLGGQTRVTTTMLFETTEHRDGTRASGMERGVNETYARIDELLVRLAG